VIVGLIGPIDRIKAAILMDKSTLTADFEEHSL
jgi:hypothetical protein